MEYSGVRGSTGKTTGMVPVLARTMLTRSRLIATLSTSLAITGYIIQFIGLRALHWSATIVQLGITLITTAIRAWVRRGLASDPHWYPLLEGHEVASLALLIHSHSGESSKGPRSPNWIKRLLTDTRNVPPRHKQTEQFFYELIFYCFDHFKLDFLSLRAFRVPTSLVEGPLKTLLDFQHIEQDGDFYKPLRLYASILSETAPNRIDKEASTLSEILSTVIENIMDKLDQYEMLQWNEGMKEHLSKPGDILLSWGFDMRKSQPESKNTQ